MSKPLFSFGTSRGGTTFFARILSVNDGIKMASDPFLPFYRSFRNEVVRAKIDPGFDGDQPLHDYYFYDYKQKIMNAVQNASFDLPFPEEQTSLLREKLSSRMDLAAKEVVPFAGQIHGSTYKEIMDRALDVLNKVYDSFDACWCGANDNWVIEFLPLLAGSYPDAKFIVIIRNPRGAMSSALKVRDKKNLPHLVPLTYSFAHNWRKHVSFTVKLQKDHRYKDKMFVIRYEDLVSNPEEIINNLCVFLGVKYISSMLDPRNFRPLSGDKWTTYSNYDVPENVIYKNSVDSWKSSLEKRTVDFIEYICSPEMRVFGYYPEEYKGGKAKESVKEFLEKDDKRTIGWRGDHKAWDIEIENENKRKELIHKDKESLDKETINKYFLFGEVYDSCKEAM